MESPGKREIIRIGLPPEGMAIRKLQQIVDLYDDEGGWSAQATIRHRNGALIIEVPAPEEVGE